MVNQLPPNPEGAELVAVQDNGGGTDNGGYLVAQGLESIPSLPKMPDFSPAGAHERGTAGRLRPAVTFELPATRAENTVVDRDNVGSTREAREKAETKAAEVLALAPPEISHTELWKVLKHWKCTVNKSRGALDEEGDPVLSDTFGLVLNRVTREHSNSADTRDYPNFTMLLNRYLDSNLDDSLKHFKLSSICVNDSVKCKRHRDSNNEGPSVIVALGPWTSGGALRI